jgi:hypothetical protein
MKSIDLVMALISLALIAIFAIFMAMFGADEVASLRKQAVERGHAEYVVDSDGKTTWQWKDKQ